MCMWRPRVPLRGSWQRVQERQSSSKKKRERKSKRGVQRWGVSALFVHYCCMRLGSDMLMQCCVLSQCSSVPVDQSGEATASYLFLLWGFDKMREWKMSGCWSDLSADIADMTSMYFINEVSHMVDDSVICPTEGFGWSGCLTRNLFCVLGLVCIEHVQYLHNDSDALV